jgi:hypothetical protein|nr:MAG TPA: hypothetical protein [Caudoviricetes sp.]
MKIGDKVKLIITEEELNEILKTNKELEKQIMECYNVKIGIIVDKFLPSKFISENYYCLDTNDNVAWKESELELIKEG